jgi:hypothetical protein
MSDLRETFPQAHMIVLWRNPLAVLCSIVRTWVKGKWHRLHRYRSDLMQAPGLLLNGVHASGKSILSLSYEELVRHPDREIQKLCESVGVPFVPEIIEYAQVDGSRWPLGDQQTVYQHTRPAEALLDRWLLALRDPQTWRLADDYLTFLGRDNVRGMGYNYDEMRALLEARRPNRARLLFTSSLSRLIREPAAFDG